jgi:acyl-CoA reductase-like NAD-dependent aldehyde dehydrogenase
MSDVTATELIISAPQPGGRWSGRDRWRPEAAQGDGAGWRPQLDPALDAPFTYVLDMTPEQAAAHVARMHSEYRRAGGLAPAERAELMRRMADLVTESARDLGELDSLCTGKLHSEGERTATGGAALLRYYADRLDESPFTSEPEPVAAGVRQLIEYVPLGMVACILPWNYPLSQACARMAMLMASGNAAVFKGSELAQPPMLALEELAREAGWPAWAYSVVTGGPAVGQAIAEADEVRGICFTGGVGAGLAVAGGAASTLKRTVLELGGKTPNIVCADADFDAAVAGVSAAAFRNQGQVCSAGSLLYVERPLFQRFVEAVAERAKGLRLGHQLDPQSQMGPVISAASLARIEQVVAEARAAGATVLAGGERPEAPGHFYPATVLADVPSGVAVADDEVFGPVLVAAPFDDEQEIIDRTNASPFGLAAAVWTRDLERAERIRSALEVGIVWVNVHGPIPRNAPWGGFRLSGLGRLYGDEGLRAFTEARSSYIQSPAS